MSSTCYPEHRSAEREVLRGGDLVQPEGVKAGRLQNLLWAVPRGYCRWTGLNRTAEHDSRPILGGVDTSGTQGYTDALHFSHRYEITF